MLSPKLDPEIRAILEAMAAQGGAPLETLPVTEAREAGKGLKVLAGEPEPVAHVEDLKIPGPGGLIPIRVYTPEGAGPFPGVVYFHGGGWVICDLETHDNICRAIARRSGAVVVSVDYRLAPEHKFPSALEDSYAATLWTVVNAANSDIDPIRVAVAGDSAGGNMATVIAARCRDENGPPLALQVLVYPVTNCGASDTQSRREFAEDHFLTATAMDWFLGHYFATNDDRVHPYASPERMADLRGLPPALVITAECDPLCDEGEAYADRLKQAGVLVTATRYAGMIHPFFGLLGVSAGARKAMEQVCQAIHSMQPARAAHA